MLYGKAKVGGSGRYNEWGEAGQKSLDVEMFRYLNKMMH
jgi:hypothetical protein